MDIPRPDFARKRKMRLLAYAATVIATIFLLTLRVSRLKPASPTVEHTTIWLDTVHRGEMVREVRGLGILVPVNIRWIAAQTAARVDKIVLQSGATVKPDSVVLELSDTALQQEELSAEYAYRAAQADLANLQVQLASSLMTQKSAAADVETQFQQANLQASVDKELFDYGIQAKVLWKKSSVAAEQLAIKRELIQEQLKIAAGAAKAQIAAEDAHVQQQRALYELKKNQVDALRVRAGITGVLQAVPVELGQQVAPGTNLVRVADLTSLKAQVQIPEIQARDLQQNQRAEVDTHTAVAPGHVTRIDAAVVNGTVTVDISFDGPHPRGARPDMSVDGAIELERLEDVLYVGLPVQGRANSTSTLFKVTATGKDALRTPVQFGQSSLNTIQILRGLDVGDEVILSDMSAWDAFDRIRIN